VRLPARARRRADSRETDAEAEEVPMIRADARDDGLIEVMKLFNVGVMSEIRVADSALVKFKQITM
jgi:hypothetical protein